MYLKVLSTQIPQLWDIIKFSVGKVYKIEKNSDFIFNNVLQNLLNDKYQCFVSLSDDRKIDSLVITELYIHKISGVRTLNIACLYSFKYRDLEGWKEFFDLIADFAKSQNCSSITAESFNTRIWEIAEYLGFIESSRIFTYKLGEL